MKNKNFLYMILYGLGICVLTVVFNLIFNMYQVTTLHRVICIITISFSTALYVPFYKLFFKELHKSKKEKQYYEK